MANAERYEQNSSPTYLALTETVSEDFLTPGEEEIPKGKPLYEVKSGNTTLELTSILSKAEDALRKAQGYIKVYIHNSQRGYKKCLVSREALSTTALPAKKDEIVAQARTDFRIAAKIDVIW